MPAKRKPVIREVKGKGGIVTHLTQVGSSSPRRRRVTGQQKIDKAQLAADLFSAAAARQQAGDMPGMSATAIPGVRPGMEGEGSVADSLFPDAIRPPSPGNTGDPRHGPGTPAGDALAALDRQPGYGPAEPGYVGMSTALPPAEGGPEDLRRAAKRLGKFVKAIRT